jgi:hypothetical protein
MEEYTPQRWLDERDSLEIALEFDAGGTGESDAESRSKSWIVDRVHAVMPGLYERRDAALLAFAAGDHEPLVLIGHDIRTVITALARVEARSGAAPWRKARNRNAEVLAHFRGWRSPAEPAGGQSAVLVAPRTQSRARGAGRPRAVVRSSSRAGDSGDEGSGSSEGDGDPPARPSHLEDGQVGP